MVFTKFASLLALALAAVAASQVSAMPRVDAGVHRTLREQATVNIVVTMKTGVDAAINSVHEADFNTRGQKIAALVTTLEVNAKSSQSSLDKLLSQEASSLFASEEAYWITNQRIIKGATIELVEKLAAVPEIAEIREEVVVPAPVFTAPTNSTVGRVGLLANEWGITKVDAPSVWATGNRGQGIVVGSLDTGVRATHVALAPNFRPTFNWFDAVAGKTTPYDDIGHGSHTIGTMVGLNGIGMAPAAQFISCNAFTADGGQESWLLKCAQFLTCPTTPDGKNKDCSKAPHIVSNSWGGGRGDKFFAGAISAWRAAGIIPVFANGNAGAKAPFCNTANSPADDPNVIAVGATDQTDKLGAFSSKGPTAFNTIKPELSAPGVDVRSAWGTGNTAFNTIPGTSMATPHVSGAIALMLSKNPKLTFDQIRKALISTTDTASLKPSGRTCGGTPDTTFPNNQYGYGRLNAFRAVNAV